MQYILRYEEFRTKVGVGLKVNNVTLINIVLT